MTGILISQATLGVVFFLLWGPDMRPALRRWRTRCRRWRQRHKRPCPFCTRPKPLAEEYMRSVICTYGDVIIVPKELQCPACGRRMKWPG